ncbi:hypothetical protein DTO021D3_5185 [Paecilomyces variotii]|nr:hypothetical protein DTO032I3_6226 [Paecilomyces variotii]KAJ9262686.1 hypothetical protein DTO195F2_3407 [Paecilomyces variotii]KAJ9277861.1 hypothetical protein DTO021D3_5185 [Paecilomyces variotii]KAJ9306959.1 hypothetical protein DTO217A2_3549 [Paecilomyces variotii]KAJ9341524.1 hypothetical protein DTO027B6_5888 [Paecilomyces variotii]
MDLAPQDGSNKVTVECTDPFNVLPDVQPILEKRLPLRNLHWKSPSRPLRSIESLYIDLVPEKQTDEQNPSNDPTTATIPHRRHQIPGLRQTPYLKIFFLRCDDNESYKATCRKQIREWIKTHTSTAQASGAAPTSQEKHDAFEWLIVHVVQDGEAAEKTASIAKWGRGSTTVLEKVKADFNGSSKTAVDRVAQLRLPKPGATQKPPDFTDLLEDLVEKMKNAILTSFDLRVSQYEEDIREKDSQRSLPGWNFCTFFILKEGLARGFENVGLFEDALAGYDELSVGLDTAVRDQLLGEGEQHGGGFLTYTKNWKEKAESSLEALSKGSAVQGDGSHDSDDSDDNNEDGDEPTPTTSPVIDPDDYPLDSAKKPYREMILSSDISIFDFRVYLFSRQMTLLLRAARAPSVLDKDATPAQKNKKPEDLTLLAEVCERATEFISIAARTLRYDLECGLEEITDEKKAEVINNLVSTWTYAAASQVLTQTDTPALPVPDSSLRKKKGSTEASTTTESKPAVPKRSSSLLSPVSPRPPRPKSQEIFSAELHNPTPSRSPWEMGAAGAVIQKTGSEELASARGELCFLARRVLEDIGRRLGWASKWKELDLLFDDSVGSNGDMQEVSLDDAAEGKQPKPSEPDRTIVSRAGGIDLLVLSKAIRSKKNFYLLYEELTDLMFRLYVAANRTNSAEMAMTEMSLLLFLQGDYETAASHLHQLAPFYGNSRWTILEGSVLELYGRCLKELKRNEEYVRILLKLLANYAADLQSQMSDRQKATAAFSEFTQSGRVSKYVKELFNASSALPKEISASFSDFFADLEVSPAIRHYKDKDGFELQMSTRFLLEEVVKVSSIKMRLVSANTQQSNEVWLESSEEVVVKPSLTKLLIPSSITLQGKYFVDRVELRSGNIVFSFGEVSQSAFLPGLRDANDGAEEKRPYIYCHPSADGLEARIISPRYINLEHLRTVDVELESGWNDIKKGVIRVRPATAGLRLRIAESAVVEGEINVINSSDSGNIEFTDFPPGSSVRFRIPYTVDDNHTMLSAKLEVGYETEKGKFTYSSSSTVVSTLPVSVNVQDVFKNDILFSKFTVSPAMMIPLRILGCDIPSSDSYEVQSSIQGPVAFDVFPKQPASILYKIKQRTENQIKDANSKRSLRLTVEFTCLDDECLTAIKQRFAEDIEKTQLRHLTRLLTPHIVEAFRTQLSTTDMETIGVVREVETLPYESVQWDTILGALPGPQQPEVKGWLMEWHKKNPTIPIPDPDPSLLSKQIVIPVDVPEVPIVHTAELRLTNIGHEQPAHAAVGQTIAAELVLRHTRRWASSSSSRSPETSSDAAETATQPVEFSYEVLANPEIWLLGGRRRGNFTAPEGETRSFPILLLPQRPGHLLLPGLDIKTFAVPSPAVSGGGVPSATAQRKLVPCEVDYRNHGETLLVLPDLKKTTVSLSQSAGGGSWLVDSERRVEVGS